MNRRIGKKSPYAVGAIVSLVFAFLGSRLIFAGQHPRLILQVFVVAFLFGGNFLIFWVIGRILHPKPWVERRQGRE
jgi:hypothetical protein